MDVLYQEKYYNFLEDVGIMVPVYINKHQTYVKAMYLPPEVFGTVPMFFLTTDVPENDYLARTITHKLYDSDLAARIAQYIVLGIGGAKVVEHVWGGADVYHLNENHALPLAFHLHSKDDDVDAVKQKMVMTTHVTNDYSSPVHEPEGYSTLWVILVTCRSIKLETSQAFTTAALTCRWPLCD